MEESMTMKLLSKIIPRFKSSAKPKPFHVDRFTAFFENEQRLTTVPPGEDNTVDFDSNVDGEGPKYWRQTHIWTPWQICVLQKIGTLILILGQRKLFAAASHFIVNIRETESTVQQGLDEVRSAIHKMAETGGEGAEKLDIEAVQLKEDESDWATYAIDAALDLSKTLESAFIAFNIDAFLEQLGRYNGLQGEEISEPRRQGMAALQREVCERLNC